MKCPRCGSEKLQKKGIRTGKQRYRCTECKANFCEGVTYKSAPMYLKDPDKECLYCGSKHIVRDGKLLNGKQRYKCVECGRDFSDNTNLPKNSKFSEEEINKIVLYVFQGKSIEDTAIKFSTTPRSIKNIMQKYYEKEVITPEKKKIIINYGYFLKVPIDYLAEYVPCSRKACEDIIEKCKREKCDKRNLKVHLQKNLENCLKESY